MDDVVDHWEGTHDAERISVLRQFVEFTESKKIRVTFVSGDVHVGAMCRLVIPNQSSKEMSRMYNLVSSPVGNLPANAGRVLAKTYFKNVDPVPLEGDRVAEGELVNWLKSDNVKDEHDNWILSANDNFIAKRNWLELRASKSENTLLKATLHVEEDYVNSDKFTLYFRKIPAII